MPPYKFDFPTYQPPPEIIINKLSGRSNKIPENAPSLVVTREQGGTAIADRSHLLWDGGRPLTDGTIAAQSNTVTVK